MIKPTSFSFTCLRRAADRMELRHKSGVLAFSAASLLPCDKASPALRFSGAWLLLWQDQRTEREEALQLEADHSPRQA